MAERSKLEQDVDLMAKQLKSWEGMQVRPNGKYAKYFDLIYYHEGKEDDKEELILLPISDILGHPESDNREKNKNLGPSQRQGPSSPMFSCSCDPKRCQALVFTVW